MEIPQTIPRAALVTGGAKRLGQAMALAMARSGFDIAIHYAGSIVEAEETVAAIRGLGRRAVALHADLGEEAEVTALLPATPGIAISSRICAPPSSCRRLSRGRCPGGRRA